jgi:hypothetical protein
MDKSKALMNTAQGRKLWYQDLKPKNFSIKELQKFTQGVKEYNEGAQDYERARRKVQEGKIPTSDFARMYDEKGWGKYDQATMKEGYKGQYQDAVDQANTRKEANMGVTDAVLEFTGAPALFRIAKDPMGTLEGVGDTAADIAMSANPGIGSVFGAGNSNINPLTGNQYWSGLDKTLDVAGVLPGIGSLGNLAKVSKLAKNPITTGVLNYGTDVIQTSKQAGKLALPKYKNVYRVEPTSFTKDLTDELSGRWIGELEEMPFYVRNLKDPNAGVRIMRQKMPVTKWENISGHNMPQQAKMFSAGTGDYKTVMDAVKAGELSPGAAKRLQAGTPVQSDLIEISSNPNLINLNEGIISEKLANNLRTLNKNRLFSTREKVEFPVGDLGKEGAFAYLFNIKDYIEKPILNIPRSYFPFNDGGITNNQTDIFIDVDNEDDIQRYIDQGYIVEFDEGGFVPNREIKLISNTPKQLPVAKKEAIPVQAAPTRSFTERPVNLISSPGMTEYAKNILTKREQVPIEELQKRYSTQPEPVAQEPLSFPGIKNLRNANLSTPVISAATQPIAGGMGSQISNVGKAGVVDQSKLSKTEKELAKLDKQNEKLKEVVTPGFIDRLIKSQAQAFSTGPDINKVSDDVNNLVQMGQNYLNRQNLKTSDAPEVSVKPIVNKEPEIKNPIITGDPIYLNDRRYYTQEVVDLNNVKFGYRNRGEYKDINTEAGNVTAFNPFQPKASFNISKIKPNETFIGIDKNGKFKTGTIDSFTSDDLISKTFKNQVIDFVYNSDGTVKLEKRNKDNPNSPVPVVKVMENGKEKIGSLNFLTKSNVKDPHNQFGEIQGGRVILKAGNETILVSGSINDVVTQFKKLKEKTKTPVEIFTLDNGSYNLGIRTKDKKITSSDLKEYDNLNSSGGNFLYLLNTDESKKTAPNISFKPKSISDVTKVKPVKDIPDFSNLIDSPTARYFKKEIIDKNYSYGMSTDPLLKAKGATGKGLPGEKEIDCSGAICKVLSQKGIKIENPTIDNSAQHFYDKSKPVKWANIKDGDLITMRTSKGKVDHIGFLVIDKKTGKKFIAESSRSFNEGRIVPFKQRIEFLKSKYPDFTYSVRRL